MAKVLIVDFYAKGHNKEYLENILKVNEDNQVVILYPENILGVLKVYNCIYNQGDKQLCYYLKFLKQLRNIIKKENPDFIHILTGDMLYRYLGIGLKRALMGKKTLITFHHIRNGILHEISLKNICKSVDLCVVHSLELKNQIMNKGIKTCIVVEYPHFHQFSQKKKDFIRSELNIPQKAFVFGAFGGTRYDKGLDILLDAMKIVAEHNKNCYLLIAGKPVDFDEKFIFHQSKYYRNQIKAIIKPIPNDLYEDCMKCTDAVVLPYRSTFNGASGPLNEGAAYGKIIIGPEHGNLGNTILKNHLGYTFDTENIKSLVDAMEKSSMIPFHKDQVYCDFQRKLNPQEFNESYKVIYNNLLNS